LRREGARGIVSVIRQRVRGTVSLDEIHVWYELALAGDRPQLALPPELRLIRGRVSDTPLLDELPSHWIGYTARQEIEAGNDLWLVLDGQRPVFTCWMLRGSVRELAATSGQLELPPETVFVEGSATSPSYRGRGFIAPAVYSQIADKYQEAGIESIIARVAKDNVTSRLVVARAGFCEVATARVRRRGLRQRTVVQVGTGTTAGWLAEQFWR
jgi:hypothetical protein